MGFWEWMGFENPRDSPKTEQPKEGLPQVTDNVRDSGQTFVFGRSNAGEQVDEKAAMQIPTVYACVRLLAESIAALPLHLYLLLSQGATSMPAVYGTAFVMMVLILVGNMVAAAYAEHCRRQWNG